LDNAARTRQRVLALFLPIAASHPAQLYFCGAIVNVLVGVNLAAVATAHMTQGAAARFLVTTFNSGFYHAFSALYFIGIVAAPVLMGFALWRSRTVPRWLAVLFVLGLEVAQQASSAGPVVVVLFTLPFAAAMVLLAVRIWQAPARPASHTPPPTAIVTAPAPAHPQS